MKLMGRSSPFLCELPLRLPVQQSNLSALEAAQAERTTLSNRQESFSFPSTSGSGVSPLGADSWVVKFLRGASALQRRLLLTFGRLGPKVSRPEGTKHSNNSSCRRKAASLFLPSQSSSPLSP